jgi:hypothetical protein
MSGDDISGGDISGTRSWEEESGGSGCVVVQGQFHGQVLDQSLEERARFIPELRSPSRQETANSVLKEGGGLDSPRTDGTWVGEPGI